MPLSLDSTERAGMPDWQSGLQSTRSGEKLQIRNCAMDPVRIKFEPFIDQETRQFIVNGVDYYNVAATGLPDYCPVNYVLRGERGDVLGGLLGQLWGG
jgi:hypothetical protein